MPKHEKIETVIGGCQRRGERGGEKQVREIKRYKFAVTKQINHRCEMYSVGNIVNNCLISLVTDGNQTHDDHFELYRNIKSWLCTRNQHSGVGQLSFKNKQTDSQ